MSGVSDMYTYDSDSFKDDENDYFYIGHSPICCEDIYDYPTYHDSSAGYLGFAAIVYEDFFYCLISE
jgi:hypothetical protein